MQVYTTLRSGGDFRPRHVQALQRQVLQWSPAGTTFTCLSDIDIPGVTTIPLKTNWPTWWAKFELLGPEFTGDFLYLDIDTVIVGPIDDFLKPGQPLTTYRGCGALQWLTEDSRKEPGAIFRYDPEGIIAEYSGEDIFLRAVWTGQHGCFEDTEEDKRNCSAQYEDILPGKISYRAKSLGCRPIRTAVPRGPDTRIIIFSGAPRPWHLPEFRGLYL